MTAVPAPPIVQSPGHSANRDPNRSGYAWEGLVLHIAEGSMAGIISWFATPPGDGPGHRGRDAHGNLIGPSGATFSVSKAGVVHQHFPLSTAPYAHGVVRASPRPRVVADNPGASPNWYLLAIEHEGRSGEEPTDAQFEASTDLAAFLFDSQILPGGATNVAVDRHHILRHGEIDPVDRARCPGWSEATMLRYVARVQEIIAAHRAQPAPPPPPPPPTDRDQLVAELRGMIAAAKDDAVRAAVREAAARAKLEKLGVRDA